MRVEPRVKKRPDRIRWRFAGIRILFFRTAPVLPFSLRGDTLCFQICQPQQIVGCRPQVGDLLDLPAAHVTHFAQPSGLFQPAEHLLDLCACALADLVAEGFHAPQHPASCLAALAGTRHPLGSDRHVRRDLQLLFQPRARRPRLRSPHRRPPSLVSRRVAAGTAATSSWLRRVRRVRRRRPRECPSTTRGDSPSAPARCDTTAPRCCCSSAPAAPPDRWWIDAFRWCAWCRENPPTDCCRLRPEACLAAHPWDENSSATPRTGSRCHPR